MSLVRLTTVGAFHALTATAMLLALFYIRALHAQTSPTIPSKDVSAIAYRIAIQPSASNLTFTGEEEIDIQVKVPTNTVILNAAALTFKSAAIVGNDDSPAAIHIDAPSTTVNFEFPHALTAGRHTLRIAYSGAIHTGLFTVSYEDGATEGAQKKLLLTQFEFSHARYMFPCWDDPAAKATFTLTATVPTEQVVLSNTPVAHTEPVAAETGGAPSKRVTFAETPKMSPYLLVLVAGDLHAVSGEAVQVPIRAWTTGRPELAEAAVHTAEQLLPLYRDYLGAPYSLPKLDIIAVPHLSFDAMENWGGITFEDRLLLYDPQNAGLDVLQAMHHLVGHEVAHQWFGDLVTTQTWNDVWLNESLAEWMSYKATQSLNPQEKPWLNFLASANKAMDRDAGPNKSIVGNSFDANTSYRKGPAILRMVETYLGEETFQRGIRAYIHAHAFGNATTADLWRSLEDASGKPVGSIASTFTDQPGIPLVKMETRCVNGQTVATLSQGRFAVDYPDAELLTWKIPITIGFADGLSRTPQTLLLEKGAATASFPGCTLAIKANLGGSGYYRVAYGEEASRKLSTSFARLAAADRVNLLNDRWALVQAGQAEAGDYLALTSHLATESEPAVLSQVIDVLRQIDTLERGSATQGAFRSYARSVLQPAMQRSGWTEHVGEDSAETLLRAHLIAALGEFDDDAVVAESRRRFQAWRATSTPLPVSLRGAILETVGRHADQATFDQLHALAKAVLSPDEVRDLYAALASVQDAALIDQAVALTAANPPEQPITLLIGLPQRSDADRVWQDIQHNRQTVMGGKLSAGLLDAIAQHGLSLETAKQVPNDPAFAGHTAGSVRDIQVTAKKRPRILAEVAAYLKK